MSSGSLKDLTKAISKAVPKLSLPLPTSLLEVISTYLERHVSNDDSEFLNLQDELLAIYKSTVLQYPSSLTAFLAILLRLKHLFPKTSRLLQWWDDLLKPVLINIGIQPKLADETRDILLDTLVYDEDDSEGKRLENVKATSFCVAEILLSSWLSQIKKADDDFDDHAGYVAGHIQLILIEYGKKRPKDFLIVLDKFFIRPESRISSLSLLCSFLRHPPPHLHQMLLTPLFVNLLRCLQFDTSTSAVSLAMTALAMFLPHIPCTLSQHLPALFNIYTRMLFWDRVRKAENSSLSTVKEKKPNTNENEWIKLPHLLDSNDESVPELLQYFTFLYGLYPINFINYIHEPQQYLGQAFNLETELDIQPIEVRQRSEPLRQVHLLHPNFFTYTIESELCNDNRWIKSDAADVVAECMALYIPSEDSSENSSRLNTVKFDTDFTSQSLCEDNLSPSQTERHERQQTDQSTNLLTPQKRISLSSLSIHSVRDLQEIKFCEASSAPETNSQEEHLGSTQYHNTVSKLSPTIFHKHNMLRSVQNTSVSSLTLSNQNDHRFHSSPTPLNQNDIAPSPFLYTKPIEPLTSEMRVAYLYREIQLLRNVLNFERYLKQQHLSHIGKLRRKHIREARNEAETQTILTSNRSLQLKLQEAKRLITQLRKEAEKSKSHWRQWEAELSIKLRSLREEQRIWVNKRQEMSKEIKSLKANEIVMRQIILKLEADELKEKQKAAHVQSNIDELERLRTEIQEFELRVRIYEVNEQTAKAAKEDENLTRAHIVMLEEKLKSRDQELLHARKLFNRELLDISKQAQNKIVPPKFEEHAFQKMIDGALDVSRTRINELQKRYDNLVSLYSKLQDQYYNFHDKDDESFNIDEILCSGSDRGSASSPLDYGSRQSKRKFFQHTSKGSGRHEEL
ncbi:Tuberous sclerosis 1 protein-like protein [Erysiphe neolycopersici]|uniref:Tuberous sclerosis 1 protein-like protein n=1 Tax=Erysiphe neolycopersici TaxID=212602 RepID=A0A420I2S1_9PEZI|nr:Tuberous sclerosis 1 protein-like protein [Erysiphe neolycopersici]